jgi:hypothetical protein
MGMSPASFGRPQPPPASPLADIPVISLGQIQAELVLTVSEQSLHDVGSAIATMVADATAQGFAAGWEHATGQPFGAGVTDPSVPLSPPADKVPDIKSGVDLDHL